MPSLARFVNRSQLGFPLLADKGSKVIGGLGLIDTSVAKTASWYGFAKPIILVLDPDGVVTHRFSTQDYRNRPDITHILDALRASS